MNVSRNVTFDSDSTPRGLRPLVALGSRQGGYVATRQAREAGVSRRMLSYYCDRGDLVRDSYGIYRVRWMPRHRYGDVIAAWLWAGPDAAASMETALVVHDLSDAMPSKIHVTVARPFAGQRDGVVVHVAPLPSQQRVVVDDVPLTSIARTLVDVVSRNRGVAVQAAREAMTRGVLSRRALRAAADGDDVAYEMLMGSDA
jgi:predicted transcriptional regulator of viral defense system